MEIWPAWYDKTIILPNYVSTIAWLHYLVSMEIQSEKARWELHCCFVQILEKQNSEQQMYYHLLLILHITEVRCLGFIAYEPL